MTTAAAACTADKREQSQATQLATHPLPGCLHDSASPAGTFKSHTDVAHTAAAAAVACTAMRGTVKVAQF
jgi:hypothetical protein